MAIFRLLPFFVFWQWIMSTVHAQDTVQPTHSALTDTLCRTVRTTPYLISGSKALERYYQWRIDYPQDDIENKREGTVWISFTIDTTGRVTKVHALPPPDDYLGSPPTKAMIDAALWATRQPWFWMYPEYVINKAPYTIKLSIAFRLKIRW